MTWKDSNSFLAAAMVAELVAETGIGELGRTVVEEPTILTIGTAATTGEAVSTIVRDDIITMRPSSATNPLPRRHAGTMKSSLVHRGYVVQFQRRPFIVRSCLSPCFASCRAPPRCRFMREMLRRCRPQAVEPSA